VPAAFVLVDSMPLTRADTIDRKALLTLVQGRAGLQSPYLPPRNALEFRLVGLWEEVLQFRPVGVRDPFFRLGGDSMAAVELFMRIRAEFGKELPLAELFEAGTVERLARAIAQDAEPERPRSLVAIQPHGANPPFYCVHGIGGEVLIFEKLARHLGEDQPFLGLQARGIGTAEEPLASVEEMAACYLQEVLEHQPQGPYYLGGFSLGGAVALEMAQRLRASGHEVGLLAILDKRTGIGRKSLWDHAALANFLRNLPNWVREESRCDGFRGLLARLWAKAPMAHKRIVNLVRSRFSRRCQPDVEEIFDLNGLPVNYQQVLQKHYEASRAYTPRPYPGRVTLLRARTQALLRWESSTLGWSELAAGGVEVLEVPGDHGTILTEPHVQTLARQIRGALVRARRAQPATS
jgi:thioesterase domain-containing protein